MSPPEAQAAGSPSTRERILLAAVEVAGREGLASLTTRRVAREAGVNLGLLHYHFESKESLVRETLSRFLDEMRHNVALLGRGDPGEEVEEGLLVEVFSTTLELAARRPALVFGLMGRLVEAMANAVRGGAGMAGTAATDFPDPVGALAAIQGALLDRVRPLFALRLGGDADLVSRRSVQLFTSIFHPLVFTPLPGSVFGCDLSTSARRRAYVRAVVRDALAAPAAPRT